MPRLLVDTNVLLDLVSRDRPAHGPARAFFERAVGCGDCVLLALASSLKDVYFIYERHYGSESDARGKVRLLSELLVLCDCDAELVNRALSCDEPDFEDGLVRCAAERAGADGIVTRDKPGFAGGKVPKMGVEDALRMFEQ